ncbi:restriction endonuclease subunit S [Flavobacterium sp.]|jgi:type I restriction enzyme S subunit|uniref:restriction endonuclease subunit S n=1 Tax=Flavobacterium sp. TaxID=239 RepID=UPI0037C14D08
MSNLKLVYLKDVADSQTGPFGSQLHQSDYVSEGTPMVTVEHLGIERFTHQNLPFVSDKDRDRLSKYILNEGDIVFSRVGSVDRCTYVTKEEDGWMFSGRCIRVRANEKANGRFLNFYFRQDSFKKMMLDISVGATMPSLNTKLMDNIPLRLPNYQTQQKIAKVLSDLDTKIELNNKINAELEAMAKTFYDYWFVQFDFPDANGKPYKSSGGKMVLNEELKREIPEGWEVKELIDIESNIITGKTPSTKDEENFGGDIPFVTIDDIRQQLFVFNAERTLTKKGGDSQINKYLQPGDICVSCIGTIGVIGIIGKICQTNQQINSISNISDYNRYFLLNALKDYFHFNVAAKKGAVLDNMNKGDFSIIPILDATTDLKIRYNKTVKSFYSKIEINLKENQELASLRDWLLPMLMNGQVSVGDAKPE